MFIIKWNNYFYFFFANQNYQFIFVIINKRFKQNICFTIVLQQQD